jgi:hypothetical protein
MEFPGTRNFSWEPRVRDKVGVNFTVHMRACNQRTFSTLYLEFWEKLLLKERPLFGVSCIRAPISTKDLFRLEIFPSVRYCSSKS